MSPSQSPENFQPAADDGPLGPAPGDDDRREVRAGPGQNGQHRTGRDDQGGQDEHEGQDGGQPIPKSARTRQRILDSAARIFRQQGYGARLTDIASEAGMQAGSLYYHFDGRESLVAEVLRIGIESAFAIVDDALAAVPADATPLDRLVTAVRAHASAVLEMSDYTAANSRIFPMATEAVRKEHYGYQQRYGEYFHQLYTAAVASGEVRDGLDLPVIRMLIFGATNWTAEWYRPGRGRSADHVIDQLETMLLNGLAVERRPDRESATAATG